MQKERRSNHRHQVKLSVELCHSGEAGMACRVQNLAPEGMLLENNQNLSDIGSPVELRVSWNGRTWEIPASVTHYNSECIGVMFNQRQSELYRMLTQPLGSHSNPKTRRHFIVP